MFVVEVVVFVVFVVVLVLEVLVSVVEVLEVVEELVLVVELVVLVVEVVGLELNLENQRLLEKILPHVLRDKFERDAGLKIEGRVAGFDVARLRLEVLIDETEAHEHLGRM